MVKLLSAFTSSHIQACLGDEFAELTESIFLFSFEYGRLILYRKEEQLLGEYLEEQKN